MKIFVESVTLAALLHNVVSIASATTRHVEKFGGQNVRPFPFFQFLNVSKVFLLQKRNGLDIYHRRKLVSI